MRKKQAQHLDARYVTMVENAYYYCNPPPIEKAVKKKRPPLQEYIRKLLYKDLSKVTTEKVLRQMRKLPWQDPEAKGYLICCMINIWNVKYNSIHCVANLLAGLVAYQEDVGIHVVDGVLEDIRLGMEVNIFLSMLIWFTFSQFIYEIPFYSCCLCKQRPPGKP